MDYEAKLLLKQKTTFSNWNSSNNNEQVNNNNNGSQSYKKQRRNYIQNRQTSFPDEGNKSRNERFS